MAFPYHDPVWVGAADFVHAHRAADETILAPDAFIFRFERVFRYANTGLRPDAHYDWAALHMGMLDDLAVDAIGRIAAEMRPVFANDAFVVWARNPALRRLGRFDAGLRRFRREVRRWQRGVRAAGRPVHPAFDLPDAGVMTDFAQLDRRQIKRAMDQLFAKGGYHTPTLRDRAYMADMDRWIRAMLGDTAGLRVLDLCCGDSRVAGVVPDCAEFVGVDLAEVPIRGLARRWAGHARYRFAVMAAEQLALPNAHFDRVAFIEASEHVMDFEATLGEIARVTRPGGRLIVTSQNAASLHLIVNRRLGYPNYFTSYQHFREFTAADLGERLAVHGFTVEESGGIGFSPYWEIPGVDRPVRGITDDDPELVETMRVLGRRAGADYAHTFILAARKER